MVLQPEKVKRNNFIETFIQILLIMMYSLTYINHNNISIMISLRKADTTLPVSLRRINFPLDLLSGPHNYDII